MAWNAMLSGRITLYTPWPQMEVASLVFDTGIISFDNYFLGSCERGVLCLEALGDMMPPKDDVPTDVMLPTSSL